MLSKKEVLEQSKAAMKLWGDTWREHAKKNSVRFKKDGHSHNDLVHLGAGRTMLCIANAPSFERKIDIIKKYSQDRNFDIGCVDKCLGNLLNNGIKPDFVFLADAGISYEKYLKQWIDQTEDIVLIANVTSNPDWCLNWKGQVFYFVNKDNIETEKIFIPLSGCHEVIPASSNVGNTQLVFSVQIFGYDQYLLVGYDHCWADDENYYAFEDSVKRFWMKHLSLVDRFGNFLNTSQNLYFSARWLNDFYQMMKQKGIQMFNCCDRGILTLPTINLEKALKTAKVRELQEDEKNNIMLKRMKTIVITKDSGDKALNEALNSVPVSEVHIKYIPDEVLTWLNISR
jgi:hypothetical protein